MGRLHDDLGRAVLADDRVLQRAVLELPMPIAPSPSPTTVSAAKPRMRPPLTTLVTRLTETIFSRRPSLRCSPPCILGCILAMVLSC
jgi:hypothetical protein